MQPRQLELPPALSRKEYQFDALEAVINDWERGDTKSCCVMPTGVGKTITAGLVTKWAIEQLGQKALFIAHTRDLIDQAENCFSHAFGFTTAIERGAESEQKYVKLTGVVPEVVVATVQSMHEGRMAERFKKDRFGLIIVDECHRAHSPMYQDVLGYFDFKELLGITATPDTENGKNIGAVFKRTSYQLRLTDAVRAGYLVPITIKTIPVPVNLKDIRTTGGDFNAGDLAERLNPSIEMLCTQIKANISQRQTVVFTPDVGSAQACATMLSLMGVSAEHVSGESGKFGVSKEIRKERLERFKKHDFQVICCCDLLVEGWDMKSVSCVVIARPSKKAYKVIQMVGRGTRLCPEIGKVNCLVLDLDWQTDRSSRKLCRIYQVYDDGSLDADLMANLNKNWDDIKRREPGGFDLWEKIKSLEHEAKQPKTIKVTYTGQHPEVYEGMTSTPFNVGQILDLGLKKRTDFDLRGGGPATPYQLDRLRSFGILNADTMSMWGASKMIGKLESRRKKGLASHQQVKELLIYGVGENESRNLSMPDACMIIAKHKLEIQGSLFDA